MLIKEALFVLRLKPGASSKEITLSFKELLKIALSDNDGEAVDILRKAWKIALEAQTNGVTESGKYITDIDGSTHIRDSKAFPSDLKPYEEPLIKEAIFNLPKYVLAKCGITGLMSTSELFFDRETNSLYITKTTPTEKDGAVNYSDIRLPVEDSDLQVFKTISTTAYDARAKSVEYYEGITDSSNARKLEELYSMPTGYEGVFVEALYNVDEDELASCPYCNAEDFICCLKCDNLHCSSHSVFCPYCEPDVCKEQLNSKPHTSKALSKEEIRDREIKREEEKDRINRTVVKINLYGRIKQKLLGGFNSPEQKKIEQQQRIEQQKRIESKK